MNKKVLNFFVIPFIGIVILYIITPSVDNVIYHRYTLGHKVNVHTMAAGGLDLNAVGDLLKNVKTTEQLEQNLNDQKLGVNNLDLDEDGKVDFIKVTEYGKDSVRGYSLTVEPAQGEEQEIATIEIEKTSSTQGIMVVHGNENVYGRDHYYHSRFSMGDYMLMSYLWGPRWGMWHSSYRYGYPPSYYRSYRTVSTISHISRTKKRTYGSTLNRSTTNSIKSQVKSPNASKTANSIKAPLSKPTASQKSFQSRNPSKTVRSGGFGRSR